MTKDKETVLLIKGAISEMLPEDRAFIESTAEQLRQLLKDGGERAQVALALVGAEMTAEL